MSLYSELNSRAVFRTAAAWIVMGWLFLQLFGLAMAALGAPAWIARAATAAVVLGFPVAVSLAWVLDTGRSTRARSGRLETMTVIAMMLAVVLAIGERLVQRVQQPEAAAGAVATAPSAPARATPAEVAEPALEIPPGSVAVLPFENRSTIAGTEYFVDGIHDDLLTQLARLSALKVISRTSVMEYRGSDKPLAQIGRELGVAAIMEASVQRAGDRVRISAQLADAATGKHLWGASYDRGLSAANVFEIQSEIARAIARELIAKLSPAQIQTLAVAPHTTDQAAYDLYLQARATGAESIAGDIRKRLALYEQAVAIDPQFALAIGEAGIEHTNRYWFVTRDPADRDEGRRWIDRALALDPEEPRLQWLLARHLYHGYLDYDGALAQLQRAEQGMPNGAEIFELRSWIMRRQGNFAGALEANERAMRLDPRNPYAVLEQLDTYSGLGDLPGLRRSSARLAQLPPLDDEVRLLEVLLPEFLLTGDTRPVRAALDALPAVDAEAALAELKLTLPYQERRYDEALAAADALGDAVVTTQTRLTTRGTMRALVFQARGEQANAQQSAQDALGEIGAFLSRLPDDPRAVAARAQMLAILGRKEDASREAQRAMELYPMAQDRFSAPAYMAARLRTLALLGDGAALRTALEEYIALPAKTEHLPCLLLEPVFDRFREDPGFAPLLAAGLRTPDV